MKNRIHFLPAGQVDNLGDQLINMAVVDAVRPYGEVVINDLDTPKWFVDAISAPGDRRFSEFSDRRFFSSLARILMKEKGGRETLQHYVILPPGHTSRKGFRQARLALGRYARLLLLRSLGCRIVRVGFSIGPFDRINGVVESFGSRAFDFYGVRDQESLALARKYRFQRPHLFPDLAWSGSRSQVREDVDAQDVVVVSFRSNAFGQVHDKEYLVPLIDRLRGLLSASRLAGKRVVVAFQVEADRSASGEIFEALRSSGFPVYLYRDRLTLEGAHTLYRKACCVISNRLHVLLLAGQSGSLPIALAHMKDNLKITGMLQDNDLGDLVLNVEDEHDTTPERIDSILAGRAETLKRFAKAREGNCRRIDEGLVQLFGRPGASLPEPDSPSIAQGRAI